MSIRNIKRRFFRRQWFSPAYKHEGYSQPMQRHGLAYGDVRSHQGVRRAEVGQRALLDVPVDTLHMDRKVQKKEIKADRCKVDPRHHKRALRKQEQVGAVTSTRQLS